MVDIAITRLEQLHPFPFVSLRENIESYPNLESIVWAQEEHLNAGAWTFVQPRLNTILKETKYNGVEVTYAGRGPSARYLSLYPTPFGAETNNAIVLRRETSISINMRRRFC
jgi:2-oxoglutarate dehydrogenase complex dehydrogenase (E1) component-like enzyme